MIEAKTLGQYEILQEIGRGPLGPVYAARKRATRTVVALKPLDHANLAERFLKHARTARRLSHPNIARVLDAAEAGGIAYIAMERLEGESLRKILDDGPLPIARAMQIAHDVACALVYAHLEGVVHGAIRPSNIFVLRSGSVKVADFGIGQLGGEVALASGQRPGCLNYMSPEQLRGELVDHRSDLFSLGALFYEMLTHRPPFKGDSAKQITDNILRGKPPPPSELNLHVPRALDRLVVGLLAAQPNDRPPGAPIVLGELQRLEEGLGLESGSSAGIGEPAASAPPAEPEPKPTQTAAPQPAAKPPPAAKPQPSVKPQPPPEPRVRPPMQDAPGPDALRFAPHADEFHQRHRIPDDDFDWRKAAMMRERQGPKRSAASRAAIFGAFAIVLAVPAIVFSFVVYDWSGPIDRVLAMLRKPEAPPPAETAATGATAPAAAPVAETTPEPAPAPVPEVTRKPAPAPAAPPTPPSPAEEPGASTESEDVVATAPEQPPQVVAPPAKAQEPQRAPRPVAKVQKQPPAATQKQPPAPEKPPPAAATARLILSVSPQGEIYIDGKHLGTTPPTTTFDLEPGMHRIEVRSGSRPPYLTYMMVQAGEERRIRHDFNAKPSRPAK